MKRIYFILIILLLAMFAMAYLYFSRLNRESDYNEISLHAATANSGLIFCIHNDKTVFEILKEEALLQQLVGDEKSRQISALKKLIIATPAINDLIANTNIYISFIGSKKAKLDYLISTQLSDENDQQIFIKKVQLSGAKISSEQGVMKLTLNDSTSLYMAAKKNLILISNAIEPIESASHPVNDKITTAFIAYIKQNNKLNKNSVGNLFIDFNKIPMMLRSVSTKAPGVNLALFNHQDSFSALSYNFSKEKIFFSGSTIANAPENYLNLFSDQQPSKNNIDNLLPKRTANFALYTIEDYKKWRVSLQNWFEQVHEEKKVKNTINSIEQTYHLNAESIFPRYFKSQLLTFQLESSGSLGAINVSNGDKVKQLLLDISTDYDPEIKAFKTPGLLYAYFGSPFRKFTKPYYTIIDNYLVFANQPGTLRLFLAAYKSNDLLINTPDYANSYSQISHTSSITFFLNHSSSKALLRNNIYPPFYAHYLSDKGLGIFTSMIFQLSGDKGKFQTNFLINTAAL